MAGLFSCCAPLFFLSRQLSIFYDEHSFLVFFHCVTCICVSYLSLYHHLFIYQPSLPQQPHNICFVVNASSSVCCIVAAISRRNSIINQLNMIAKNPKIQYSLCSVLNKKPFLFTDSCRTIITCNKTYFVASLLVGTFEMKA